MQSRHVLQCFSTKKNLIWFLKTIHLQLVLHFQGEILIGEEGQCPVCQKIFNSKTSLLNHIRNHSADKKYVCNYCQKGTYDENTSIARSFQLNILYCLFRILPAGKFKKSRENSHKRSSLCVHRLWESIYSNYKFK